MTLPTVVLCSITFVHRHGCLRAKTPYHCAPYHAIPTYQFDLSAVQPQVRGLCVSAPLPSADRWLDCLPMIRSSGMLPNAGRALRGRSWTNARRRKRDGGVLFLLPLLLGGVNKLGGYPAHDHLPLCSLPAVAGASIRRGTGWPSFAEQSLNTTIDILRAHGHRRQGCPIKCLVGGAARKLLAQPACPEHCSTSHLSNKPHRNFLPGCQGPPINQYGRLAARNNRSVDFRV